MKIVLFGGDQLGAACLRALADSGYHIELVVSDPQLLSLTPVDLSKIAQDLGIASVEVVDPNVTYFEEKLRSINADVFVVAGFDKPLKPELIEMPRSCCLSLHSGALPKFRGSYPLNWALIEGETNFTLSIVESDQFLDRGDILAWRKLAIAEDETICDLLNVATTEFPKLLLEVMRSMVEGSVKRQPQSDGRPGFYTTRFPGDGLILWDVLTLHQIHNRIRALTRPFSCAFSYLKERKVLLLKSKLSNKIFIGEPGRVYKKEMGELLVGASDSCLWISEAVFADDGSSAYEAIEVYDKFYTVG